MCVLYVFIILAPAGFHMDKTLIVFKRFMLQHFCFMFIKMTPPLAFVDYLGHV